jgi:hypothetical protein
LALRLYETRISLETLSFSIMLLGDCTLHLRHKINPLLFSFLILSYEHLHLVKLETSLNTSLTWSSLCSHWTK